MDAGGGPEPVAFGEARRGGAFLDARAGDDHARDAGAVRARHDRLEVVVERGVRQVGADVDQLHRRSIASARCALRLCEDLALHLSRELADFPERALLARRPGLAEAQADAIAVEPG